MKYKINYNTTGGSIIPFNIDVVKTNMLNHIDLFNRHFGVDNWAFGGSSALVLYISEFSPSDLSKINKPSDIDVIFVDSKKSNLFSFKNIGNYSRQNNTPTRSDTFINSENNDSIDVLVNKSISKVNLQGIPVLSIQSLYSNYSDVLLNRTKDSLKVSILKSIIDKNIVNLPVVVIPEKQEKTNYEYSSDTSMLDFDLYSDDELSDTSLEPPKIERKLNF